MLNLNHIVILAGFMLAAGPSFALPAQASAGAHPATDHSPEPGKNKKYESASFESLAGGHDAPPDMPWTDMAGEHGHVVFDKGHDAGGWGNRWNRLPDNPHGCSQDKPGDKPGCNFLMSLTPGDITPAVPEPETYAMMLAGLALLRFVTSRSPRRRGFPA